MIRQKIKRLANRTILSKDEFYDKYYSSTGLSRELVAELIEDVGKAIELPAGLLRPGDQFNAELAPLKGWWVMDDRLDLYDLLIQLERRYNVKLDDSSIETVDALVKAIGTATTRQ